MGRTRLQATEWREQPECEQRGSHLLEADLKQMLAGAMLGRTLTPANSLPHGRGQDAPAFWDQDG